MKLEKKPTFFSSRKLSKQTNQCDNMKYLMEINKTNNK